MRKVGEYEWRQVSMWDFSPKNCIEKFVLVETSLSNAVCHYYLRVITEIVSDNQWKTKTVESVEGVPEDVLSWRGEDYWLKIDGKSTHHRREV